MHKKCIIKENDKFEVVELLNDNLPNNFAIKEPQYNNIAGASFQIAESDVEVFWTFGYYQGNKVIFKHEGANIKVIRNPQIQSVCDYMNKYLHISELELVQLKSKIK